jgi:hypothetical protein
MQKLGNMDVKDSQVLYCAGEKLGVCACQRAEELIINIGQEEKIGRFGSVAGCKPFGRQSLQLNRTAERKAESAGDQAPFMAEIMPAALKPRFHGRANPSCSSSLFTFDRDVQLAGWARLGRFVARRELLT